MTYSPGSTGPATGPGKQKDGTLLDEIHNQSSVNLTHIIQLSNCASAIVDRLRGDRLTEKADSDAGISRSGILGNLQDTIDAQSYYQGKLEADLRLLEQML